MLLPLGSMWTEFFESFLRICAPVHIKREVDRFRVRQEHSRASANANAGAIPAPGQEGDQLTQSSIDSADHVAIANPQHGVAHDGGRLRED